MIMALIWFTASFNYFLIMFLVNEFEMVYLTALASSLSEFVAYGSSGYLYEKFGARLTFAGSFGLSVFGGILILSYGL